MDKATGDEVFAGTVNGTGTLRVRVTRPAADTVIARIVAMVSEASASKAKMQLFIEKIEQRYSIGMVLATIALFTIPLLLGADLQPTLLRAMTFMIVASPCALVLSTMPPLLSAIANAGRHGVLVKSAVVLEKLSTVTHVAFDKTGTLTEGSPPVGTHPPSARCRGRRRRTARVGRRRRELVGAPVGPCHRRRSTRRGSDPAARRGLRLHPPGHGVRARIGEDLVDVAIPPCCPRSARSPTRWWTTSNRPATPRSSFDSTAPWSGCWA